MALPLVACLACRGSPMSADNVCSADFQPDTIGTNTRTVDTMLADATGVFQIHVAVRWAERMGPAGTAPIGVLLHGGWDHIGTPVTVDMPHLDTTQPLVDIHLDLPGGGQSGGTDDERGPLAAAAVAAVLQWAHGDTVDAAGCHLQDRIPPANADDIYVVGASNGGNLAYATLTDETLDLPPLAGLVTWETPVAATFASVELGADPTVYTPGACQWTAANGIQCQFPADELLALPADPTSELCFDINADGRCEDGVDAIVHGPPRPETGELMLSPDLRLAMDERGLLVTGYASAADDDTWWAYRDASRRVQLLTQRWPDLPVLLIGSDVDHILSTWTDHPHIHGIGQALQASGAAWTRLNPGSTWLPANHTENAPDLPLSLLGDDGQMLTEQAESPLDQPLTAAVFELSSRHASGDWTSE